jgi:hypothetical protein
MIDLLCVRFLTGVKDPLRNNGLSEELRYFVCNDEVSGKLVRKLTMDGNVVLIEAISGPHKGQIIASSVNNVQWMRLTDGETKIKEREDAAKIKGKKVA